MRRLFDSSSDSAVKILDSVNPKSVMAENKGVVILDSLNPKFESTPELIVSKLSYSHLRVLIPIEDPLVRYFYEQQCMRETWSVRELRRQVTSNLHIRVGLSKNPEKS